MFFICSFHKQRTIPKDKKKLSFGTKRAKLKANVLLKRSSSERAKEKWHFFYFKLNDFAKM